MKNNPLNINPVILLFPYILLGIFCLTTKSWALFKEIAEHLLFLILAGVYYLVIYELDKINMTNSLFKWTCWSSIVLTGILWFWPMVSEWIWGQPLRTHFYYQMAAATLLIGNLIFTTAYGISIVISKDKKVH